MVRSLKILALTLATSLAVVTGCQTSGQTGVIAGAGLGALMGQAIGNNTTGTLIGAGVGAGVGYIIGNEMDKSRADEMSRRQAQSWVPPAAPAITPGTTPMPTTTSVSSEIRFTNSDVGALGDTRWAVVSVNPRDGLGTFASMIVEFRANGRVLTTTTTKEGQVRTADEAFRVVNDTLIINRPGYIINARFQVTPDQLIVSADRFSAVLQRLPG